jgi:hypothetical protein
MSEMENGPEFDEVLARVMQRVDAPEEFAAKVMAAAKQKGKLLVMPRAPVWMSGAIAAMLVLGCLVGGGVHVQHERERAQATEEYDASVQITNRVLEQTRQQLEREGISLDQQ